MHPSENGMPYSETEFNEAKMRVESGLDVGVKFLTTCLNWTKTASDMTELKHTLQQCAKQATKESSKQPTKRRAFQQLDVNKHDDLDLINDGDEIFGKERACPSYAKYLQSDDEMDHSEHVEDSEDESDLE